MSRYRYIAAFVSYLGESCHDACKMMVLSHDACKNILRITRILKIHFKKIIYKYIYLHLHFLEEIEKISESKFFFHLKIKIKNRRKF